MERRCEEVSDSLASGDSDRVNEVVEEIAEMDFDERARLFETCFDDVTAVYADSDEGYVRQSTVRVGEQFAPGLAVAVGLEDEQSRGDAVEQTDAVCGFLFEAITDEDGRVRQSAKRGLQRVFRTYDALEDTDTLEALIGELDEMADEHSGTRRKHIVEARDDAEFNLESGYGPI